MYNMCIDSLYFEWDENKNALNKEKQLTTRRKDIKGAYAYEK